MRVNAGTYIAQSAEKQDRVHHFLPGKVQGTLGGKNENVRAGERRGGECCDVPPPGHGTPLHS